ncbi:MULTISPECIES: hypothetical protein [unclassified Bilifractor]|uniref:hypothetical protein n=1 Tax=unclassified Bilifractor TaxID=2815795 RepID=UPI003F916318
MKKIRTILIQRKIKSEEGASLSVALLFFLVCAVVGSVILAAATSSVGRMKNLSSTERDKDAVYSTARLVVRRMAGKNLTDEKILPGLLRLTASENGKEGGTSGGAGNSAKVSTGNAGDSTQIVCNPTDNTLTATAQFSFYRRVNEDGTYVDSRTADAGTSGASTPESGGTASTGTTEIPGGNTADSSGTSQADTSDYLNGSLPGSPFANLQSTTGLPVYSRLNLTGYEIVRAGEIIHYFWSNYVLKDDGTLGQSGDEPGFSNDNAYNWTRDDVPGNHTWMYGHSDSVDNSLTDSAFKKQSYILNVGKGSEAIKICVDFYMDKNLNIEAQIYPYKKDNKNGQQTSTFKNASARCLVKIPANGGELQYAQDTDTEENKDTAESGASAPVAVSGTTGGSGAPSEVSPQNMDDTDGSVTYKVTVTRSVTLSGFGWGEAKVYTGSAIAAQNPAGS